MGFGETLSKIRKERKDTLRDLGEKLGVSHVYINNVEKAKTPASKNFFEKVVKCYSENEKELTEAYIEEVLPDGIAKKVLQDNKFLLEQGNDKELLNYLMADSTAENRKAVLELMILQREVEARKNGTYENRKAELEAIKKEIEKL